MLFLTITDNFYYKTSPGRTTVYNEIEKVVLTSTLKEWCRKNEASALHTCYMFICKWYSWLHFLYRDN